MVQRIVNEISAVKNQLRDTTPPGPNVEARIITSALLTMRSLNTKDLANGVLAASAENPELLGPVRDIIRQTFESLKAGSDDLDNSLIAWLAVEGLCNFEMHELSPFSEDERSRIVASIDGMLRGEKV